MNLLYKIHLQAFNVISIVRYHSGPTFGQVLNSCQDALVVDASDYSGHLITWSDSKVRELITVKVLHTSLLNTTLFPFKALPLGSYAPMPAPSPPFKTIWNWFCGMAFRAAVVLLLMSSMSSKCLPFNIS